MKRTEYIIYAAIPNALKIALCSDLHDNPCQEAISLLKEESPDLIAMPGDICEKPQAPVQHALEFMRACAGIAPTVYSLGNHDKAYDDAPQIAETIRNTGVVLLDDDDYLWNGIWIGGLTTGFRGQAHEGYFTQTPVPNLAWLDDVFCQRAGYKILLCHHPEYYSQYLRERDIQLILAGHAHGGHWRLFNRGILAPGQGLFPKYTCGVHEGRFVISRGMGDHTRIPRLFNPHEIVIIHLLPENFSDRIMSNDRKDRKK